MQALFRAAEPLLPHFAQWDVLAAESTARLQAAMKDAGLGQHHFAGSTGYGHGDLGREAFDEVHSVVALLPFVAPHSFLA